MAGTAARLEPEEVDLKALERLAAAREASAKGLAASQTALSGASSGIKVASSTISRVMQARKARKRGCQQQPPEPTSASAAAAKEIAGAGASAVVDIYHSLRAAASSVSTDVAEATVEAVTHRYGEQAGASTRDGLQAFDNIGRAAFNVAQMAASAGDVIAELACAQDSGLLQGETIMEGRWLFHIAGTAQTAQTLQSRMCCVKLLPAALVVDLPVKEEEEKSSCRTLEERSNSPKSCVDSAISCSTCSRAEDGHAPNGDAKAVRETDDADAKRRVPKMPLRRLIPLDDVRSCLGGKFSTPGGDAARAARDRQRWQQRLLAAGEMFEVISRDDIAYRFQNASDLDSLLSWQTPQPPVSEHQAEEDRAEKPENSTEVIADSVDSTVQDWVDAINAALQERRRLRAQKGAGKDD